jgi:phage terminase large subunit-like protein
MILDGRGAGKTRAGAEWVKAMALGRPQFALKPTARIALVGETAADVRDVMIEGVSGILAAHKRSERPRWESSRRRLQPGLGERQSRPCSLSLAIAHGDDPGSLDRHS